MKDKIFVATKFENGVLYSGIQRNTTEYTVICPYLQDVKGETEPTCNCSVDQQNSCASDI